MKIFEWCFRYDSHEKCWYYHDFIRQLGSINEQKQMIRELLNNGFDMVLLKIFSKEFDDSWHEAMIHFELKEQQTELDTSEIYNIRIGYYNFDR